MEFSTNGCLESLDNRSVLSQFSQISQVSQISHTHTLSLSSSSLIYKKRAKGKESVLPRISLFAQSVCRL